MTTPKTGKAPHVTFRANSDVAIHVPDLDKAKQFYCEVLRLGLKSSSPTQLAIDTGSFTLWVNKDTVAHSFIPSFSVSDYGGARDLLGETSKAVSLGGATYFVDPFGFIFDIVQE
jgi:catechol 2,3-dioxygenase-like lactoylglutathione lyase family enzyme